MWGEGGKACLTTRLRLDLHVNLIEDEYEIG